VDLVSQTAGNGSIIAGASHHVTKYLYVREWLVETSSSRHSRSGMLYVAADNDFFNADIRLSFREISPSTASIWKKLMIKYLSLNEDIIALRA
jgi:hypothetical protein